MGNRTEDDTAASRLGTLLAHFTQHPVTGPAGRSFVSAAPRATPDAPAAPINLEVVDHITASIREVVDDTLAANPDAGPLPARVEAVYGWYVANTINAPEAVRQRRDTIVYRQALEHALAMGETKVVRPHRCPDCDTFSLMWSRPLSQIVCTNRKCTTDDGTSKIVTTARIAYHHIAAMSEKTVRDCAT